MASNEVSKLIWIGIVVSLAASIYFVVVPNLPTVLNGTFDKVGKIAENNAKTVPQATPLVNVRGGNVSAWNATPQSVLDDVKAMNFNSVSVPVRVHLTGSGTDAVVDQDSLANAIDIIKTMNDNHIQTVVEPYPFVDNGVGSETTFNPSDKAEFVKNWGKAVKEIAVSTKDLGVSGLYIGSNFAQLEDQSQAFIALIDDVKTVFKEPLIYRTNFWYNATWDAASTQHFEDLKNTEFFKHVDVLSVAAYFEVSSQGEDILSVDSLTSAIQNVPKWGRGQNIIQQIEDLHNATGKPIMFGELGITNYVGAMSNPYKYDNASTDPKNEDIQSIWYQTWINEMRQYDWFHGYEIYSIGDLDTVFRPNAKGQETLKQLNAQ